jgi:hypothetical protein
MILLSTPLFSHWSIPLRVLADVGSLTLIFQTVSYRKTVYFALGHLLDMEIKLGKGVLSDQTKKSADKKSDISF